MQNWFQEDERSSKKSAIYVEESQLSDMFDEVLLCSDAVKPPPCRDTEPLLPNESGGEKSVDLRALLILCAQALSANNHTTARELLNQIRQHSCVSGDGSQRLAHYFADGCEARLEGNKTGIQNFGFYTASDVLRAYHTYLSACPFKKISNFLANKMILSVAEKATTLHIIDFGIMYGFQWPVLIQCLSCKPGGPPKLRITGIEFLQPEILEETGRRLASYCKRFNVPFEYNAVAAKNWETIQIQDLNIDHSSEVVAVNCSFRFKNLHDETVEQIQKIQQNSPRNKVLNLIRKMNPDIFLHAIVNASYNSPDFVSRFQEALIHFSALFDMLDAAAGREDGGRLMFEKELYGRAITNVVASDGSQRAERPETYQHWRVRNMSAGFKQLPVEQELMKMLRAKYKAWYHKDFVVEEDSNWVLQGWKGQIVYAFSCWVCA